ncbi:molybdopterin molybdotransferase MoeA [Algihabitans albus]|uniref:molybdopterin molybdotransferase MoeA n=1 Tax=Algihabitans albus TaxID=2164067 RepID=UPI000E5C8416|nr:gephyrin-like molybdotransferase Glp [Algihabitans albus]
MITVDEALTRILSTFDALPAETLAVNQTLGRVLASDVIARVTQPPAAVSAMDGYAVRAEDVATVPARLQVVGHLPAGGRYDSALGCGQAVRIFTGAPLPDGADTIVIQEDTERDGESVTVKEAAAAGTYIRPAGLDFRAGDVGVSAGRVVTVRDLGLIAAMNRPWVSVHRRPRVAVLATGDEVVMPGDPIGPSQIVSSNGLALCGLVEACGGEAINLGIAADSADSLRRLSAGAAGADLLVTTGGASVGEHDLIRSVLGEEGLELDFWKIAMRPGKPLMFGNLRGTPMLGLPGNPVSSLVCGLLFVRPILDRLQGLERPAHPTETAVLAEDLGANDRRQDYLRATLEAGKDGRLLARPFPKQDSSMLATLARADALIVRAPHAPPLPAGQLVDLLRFPGSLRSI